MPDWCKSTVAGVGAALLGWLLLQQLSTATSLSRLETQVEDLQQRYVLFVDKVLPMLEKRK